MGWFALAALLGLLIGWGWHQFAPADALRQFRLAAVGFAVLVLLLVLWAIYVERNSSPRGIVDALASGQVARFLIGGLLGFVAAHVLLNEPVLTLHHLFTALAMFLIAMAALDRTISFNEKIPPGVPVDFPDIRPAEPKPPSITAKGSIGAFIASILSLFKGKTS